MDATDIPFCTPMMLKDVIALHPSHFVCCFEVAALLQSAIRFLVAWKSFPLILGRPSSNFERSLCNYQMSSVLFPSFLTPLFLMVKMNLVTSN